MISPETLAKYAQPTPPAPVHHPNGNSVPFDMEAYLAHTGLRAKTPIPFPGVPGGLIWPLEECPFNPDHTSGDSRLTLVDGTPGFVCYHDGCNGKNIRDVLRLLPKPKSPRIPRAAPPPDHPSSVEPDSPAPVLIWNNAKTDLRPILANAIAKMQLSPEWDGVLAHNDFHVRIEAAKRLPWGDPPGPWTDQFDRELTHWLQIRGLYVDVKIARQAAQTLALRNCFHPVREYLQSLRWDGEPRIDSWLIDYMGAEATLYTRTVGRCFLVSAVARIFRPGSKVDQMVIFEGKQGLGKSSAAAALSEPWFTDELAEMGTKDSSIQLAGVWIVELSELSSINRASGIEHVKAFISRKSDHYRPVYGHYAQDFPRQCVFIGTTNSDRYLRDETGARRFLPVRCKPSTGEELVGTRIVRDRDQLWAEAVQRFQDGAKWWIGGPGSEASIEAEEEQSARFVQDAWQPLIDRYLDLKTDTSSAEILESALDKPKGQWTQLDQNRVVSCLRIANWERYKTTSKPRQWRYRPAE